MHNFQESPNKFNHRSYKNTSEQIATIAILRRSVLHILHDSTNKFINIRNIYLCQLIKTDTCGEQKP